jgi:hypothetical protein
MSVPPAIDLQPPPARAGSARILDGEDQLQHALQFRRPAATMVDRLFLDEGKSEVVRAYDAARTLVLTGAARRSCACRSGSIPGRRTILGLRPGNPLSRAEIRAHRPDS